MTQSALLHSYKLTALALLTLHLILVANLFSMKGQHGQTELRLPAGSSAAPTGAAPTGAAPAFGTLHLHALPGSAPGGHYLGDPQGRVVNRIGARSEVAVRTLEQIVRTLGIFALAALLWSLVRRRLPGGVVAALALVVAAPLALQTGILFTRWGDGALPLGQQLGALAATLTALLALWPWRPAQPTAQRRVLLAYASQTDNARQLAHDLARSSAETGEPVCLSRLRPGDLSQVEHALFVVSTCGDGEPPDNAIGFYRALASTATALERPPRIAVLALGDSHYPRFCAFGRQLHAQLVEAGCEAALPLATVDRLDQQTVAHWWQTVADRLGWQDSGRPELHVSDTQVATVLDNRWLNPGGPPGRPVHALRLRGDGLHWRPGDLLKVVPRADTDRLRERLDALGLAADSPVRVGPQSLTLLDALRQREWLDGAHASTAQQLVDQLAPLRPRLYSIASAPESGALDLLVRKRLREDGGVGLASGQLCAASADTPLDVAVLSNPAFQLPAAGTPLIMVAAGTGLAPFIGFLQRLQASAEKPGHWLYFGEQYPEHDNYRHEDITGWLDDGTLARYRTAWSRQRPARYIPAVLDEDRDALRERVERDGANVYVCGAYQGFGQDVIALLGGLFGAQRLDTLKAQGRIHTDLY